MPANERLTFDDPPVREVALGRTFLYRPDFLIPYFGAFWERIRNRYPKAEEGPTIVDPGDQSIEANFAPRVLFVSADSRSLVQVQQNRFHHNWRQVDQPVPYVRFPAIKTECIALWNEFDAFVLEMTGRALEPVRGELTYTNIVEAAEGQSGAELVDQVLRDVSWSKHDRYLQRPKAVTHNFVFELPNSKSRLHLQLAVMRRTAPKSGGDEALKIELTVRGPCAAEDSFDDWATQANECLVRAFKDLTTPEMHVRWKLR